MTTGLEPGTEPPSGPDGGNIFDLKEIPADRSIIVVSDLHLGGSEDPDTVWRFCRFLEYLRRGQSEVSDLCPSSGERGTGGSPGKKTLFPPEKIIMLGDILELWDSRDRDRNRAFLDAIIPLLKLRDLDCDVVFVTGNHDEDIAELLDSCFRDKKSFGDFRRHVREEWEKSHPGQKRSNGCSSSGLRILRSDEVVKPLLDSIVALFTQQQPERPDEAEQKYEIIKRPESLKIAWGGQRIFEICNRHYPAYRVKGEGENQMKAGKLGIHIGDTNYAFIHGQQFDKEQITHSISQGIGKRFDPIDFFQDLASVSVTMKMSIETHMLIVLFTWILLKIALSPDFNPLIPVIGAVTGIAGAAVFFYGLLLFGVVKRGPDRVASAPLLTVICGVGFIGFTLLVLIGMMEVMEGSPESGMFGWGIFGWLFMIPLVASLYIFAVMTIPSLIAWAKRMVYEKLLTIKSKDSKSILENEFDPATFKYETNVLIFGHTHVADFAKPDKTEKIRLLVNTGSWVHDKDTSNYDTFAYIDKTGVCCLRWNDAEEKIECFRKRIECNDVPLCEYIIKKDVKLRD